MATAKVFPEPVISVAIEPKTKADQDKLGTALEKLSEEDPTFQVRTDDDTGRFADVRRFENELLDYMRSRHSGLMQGLTTGGIPDELADAVQAFKDQFERGAEDQPAAADPTAVDADEMGDADSNKTLATE